MLLVEAAVAAEMQPSAMEMQPPAMDAGLVRKAMAYRVKYRLPGQRRKIPLSRLGVHPQNRGGVYPQPDTVRNLGLKIIIKGFNQSEADHEGVCVEEMPYGERAKHSCSDGSPYEPYADYNISKCDHPYLVKCFSSLNDIMYGTLSHSHLLLVLLSWLNGAEWKLDDEPNLSKLLNPDGTFNNAAVAACDEDLGRVLRDGLQMEVLSWPQCKTRGTLRTSMGDVRVLCSCGERRALITCVASSGVGRKRPRRSSSVSARVKTDSSSSHSGQMRVTTGSTTTR